MNRRTANVALVPVFIQLLVAHIVKNEHSLLVEVNALLWTVQAIMCSRSHLFHCSYVYISDPVNDSCSVFCITCEMVSYLSQCWNWSLKMQFVHWTDIWVIQNCIHYAYGDYVRVSYKHGYSLLWLATVNHMNHSGVGRCFHLRGLQELSTSCTYVQIHLYNILTHFCHR